MKNKYQLLQTYSGKALKLAFFVSSVFLIQLTANAQTAPERASYDFNYFEPDSSKPGEYKWTGGAPFQRTIYNPLDGGVLLKYEQSFAQGNSDGCSGPTTEPLKTIFRQACFAHDTNYDAPFSLAEFPKYEDGASTGKDIADYLFLKDILVITKGLGPGQSLGETSAASWYRAVQDFGGYRGRSDGKKILEKGGVIAVKNVGAYTFGLRVKWTNPNGVQKAEEVLNAAGRAATIPLSKNASNIEVECWAVGGKQIFKQPLPAVGMYSFTVGGTSLNPTFVADKLGSDIGNTIREGVQGKPLREEERGIKFSNQAGYVAELSVTYFETLTTGGVKIPLAKTMTTPKLTAGFSRPLIIPNLEALHPGMPIMVTIIGTGTIKNPVFQTTVPADFTGEMCYKAYGTIFDAQGSKC